MKSSHFEPKNTNIEVNKSKSVMFHFFLQVIIVPSLHVFESKSTTDLNDLSLNIRVSSIRKPDRKSSCFVDPAENFPSSRYYRNQTLERPNPWSQTFDDEEDSCLLGSDNERGIYLKFRGGKIL